MGCGESGYSSAMPARWGRLRLRSEQTKHYSDGNYYLRRALIEHVVFEAI